MLEESYPTATHVQDADPWSVAGRENL